MRFLINAITLLMMILTVGCLETKKPAATSPTAAPLPTIDFNGNTNAEMLIESIQELDLIGVHDKVGKKKDKPILIGSLEFPADSETNRFPVNHQDSIVTFVSDALARKLSTEGFLLAERDIDVLTRIYHETNDKYLISLNPDLQQSAILDEIIQYVKDHKSSNRDGQEMSNSLADKIFNMFFPVFPYSNVPFVRFPFYGKQTLQDAKHYKIKSAAYILSFRVLECGVTYRPIEERLDGIYEQVERVAVTKLHVRLTQAKTGVTLWADILQGEFREKTPTTALPYAESPNLKFYGFKNPVEEYASDLYTSGAFESQKETQKAGKKKGLQDYLPNPFKKKPKDQ